MLLKDPEPEGLYDLSSSDQFSIIHRVPLMLFCYIWGTSVWVLADSMIHVNSSCRYLMIRESSVLFSIY